MMRFLSNKKVLIVLGVIGVGILILLLISIFGGKGGTDTATTTPDGSPFGNNGGDGRPIGGGNTTAGGTTSGGAAEEQHAALFQISDAPVVAFTTFPSAGVDFSRYVDRPTGHVFETGLESVHPTAVSNVTIPRVEKATWVGNNILFQYLSENSTRVRSFYATFAKNTDPEGLSGTVNGFFIDDDSTGAALRVDGGAVFSLFKTPGGSSGVTTDNITHQRSVLFSSPLSELLVEWPTTNTIAITTKPDRSATGVLFFLDAANGRTTQVLQGMDLTTKVDTTGGVILYTEMKSPNDPSDQRLATAVFNRSTSETRILPFVTLPKKCAWSRVQTTMVYCFVPRTIPTSDQESSWYRGELFFSDNLWKIDTSTGFMTLLSIPIVETRIDIDGVEPSLSADEKYLLFRNKKDGFLYGYRLPLPPASSEIPLNAGTSTEAE